MQRPITRGASANAGLIFHVFAQDSTSTTGAGKASIAFGSWTCYYIRNGEAISGSITAQDITTIGTYAAPSANTNIRIKAVDNTNMIGIYEVQIHSDWVNTTNSCQSLTIYLSASGVAVLPIQIPLWADDMQTAKPTNFASLSIDGSGRADISKILGTAISTPATAGILDVNVKNMNNVAATSITTINANVGTTQPVNFTGTGASALAKSDVVDIAGAAVSTTTAQIGTNVVQINAQTATAAAGVTFPATLASTTNITAGTITTVTNLTNAPTNGDLTTTMKTSVTTAATAATPTAAAVTGAVGSVTARVTANTDQLAGQTVTAAAGVTFPTSVASPTNITAGTITTTTNLTNAPTNGDFTATMKTSLNAATPAVTVSDKTGFALTSAYDPAKTASQAGDIMKVSSGTGANQISLTSGTVTVGTNNDKTGYTASTVSDKTGYALTSAYDAAKTAAQASDVPTADITAIKAKTDNLPASPAAVGSAMTLTGAYDAAKTAAQAGDEMDLVDAPNATAVTAIQAGLSTLATGDIPTTAAIALAVLTRKITFDSGSGEFVIWSEDGATEAERLTPTTDAAALPIIGMEPSA